MDGAEACALGSSPRMRGTLAFRVLEWDAFQDHPRVCGEHPHTTLRFLHTVGSSPRMRGTRWSLSAAPRIPGIIPAYAGNTLGDFDEKAGDRDHPRVCGEHLP